MSSNMFTLSNPVFVSFVFYGALVLLKTFAMSILTAYNRFAHGVFGNEEDVKGFGTEKIVLGNPSVERVRRSHLNDLENIPTFLLIGLFYIATNPTPIVALWHFRVFAISRIVFTLAYQLRIPHSTRMAACTVALAVCLSMTLQVLSYTMF